MDLPTLTVAQAEADEILSHFPGDEYTAWLKAAVADEVERRVVRTAHEAANVAIKATVDASAAKLEVATRAEPVDGAGRSR